ncbi:MAG: hypothetical protein K8T25_11270 [Planctomycetia bacterium]|nr:hypothetical protein [Planctomycetia bacterium]
MTLKEQLQHELARLEGHAALAAGPQTISLDDGPRQLTCEVTAIDTLACAVTRLSVASPTLSAASLEQLHSIGQALAARLTYLLEAIAVIEVDSDGHSIQMRSQPPHREERRSTYYELVAGRGRLELHRYAKEPNAPRRSVPAHLTREVLVRLAADLIHAAG